MPVFEVHSQCDEEGYAEFLAEIEAETLEQAIELADELFGKAEPLGVEHSPDAKAIVYPGH